MQKIEQLGKKLSTNEMTKVFGGSDEKETGDLMCTVACLTSYITTCEAGGYGSEFCRDQANDYCIPFCS